MNIFDFKIKINLKQDLRHTNQEFVCGKRHLAYAGAGVRKLQK